MDIIDMKIELASEVVSQLDTSPTKERRHFGNTSSNWQSVIFQLCRVSPFRECRELMPPSEPDGSLPRQPGIGERR
ncbi:hypothetical protein GWI33_012200 [Rhynchophorus ferrugineus]|uniref:Uncharacterized protein n=1 Tax=Rhynchophorus ferrugineus TaxID=354439 RepID=A0A834M8Y6_RHYFE|nr:hypothetical protein GWI33_012200 [Rhynchophorus ferrugineus]